MILYYFAFLLLYRGIMSRPKPDTEFGPNGQIVSSFKQFMKKPLFK